MSTTTSDENTATVLNNGPVYYTEITGSAFEHVINDDGSEYKFNPAWKCTGFADSTNSRIPKRDPNCSIRRFCKTSSSSFCTRRVRPSGLPARRVAARRVR